MKLPFPSAAIIGTTSPVALISGLSIGGLIAIIAIFTTVFFVKKKRQAGKLLHSKTFQFDYDKSQTGKTTR